MTKIKLCGMRRKEDITYANELMPDYVGYVFAPKSRRYITPETAGEFTAMLHEGITPVGVFVDESTEVVAELYRQGIIRAAQLHGHEDEHCVRTLQAMGITVIKAFIIRSEDDLGAAQRSSADHILLDSGMGSGQTLDTAVLKGLERDYFLAGGLSPDNVRAAVEELSPYGVDASSGLETDGFKDYEKMKRFMQQVRSKETDDRGHMLQV